MLSATAMGLSVALAGAAASTQVLLECLVFLTSFSKAILSRLFCETVNRLNGSIVVKAEATEKLARNPLLYCRANRMVALWSRLCCGNLH